MTKTIEEIKGELEDKINSNVRKRNELIMQVDSATKELESDMEKLLFLDKSKIRVICFMCKGTGISPVQSENGKKQFCQMCGGPDKPYVWGTIYTDPVKTKKED